MDIRLSENRDYETVLAEATCLRTRMESALKSSDFDSVLTLADELSKLYAPNDTCARGVLSYMVYRLASDMFFAGADYQITKTRRRCNDY